MVEAEDKQPTFLKFRFDFFEEMQGFLLLVYGKASKILVFFGGIYIS